MLYAIITIALIAAVVYYLHSRNTISQNVLETMLIERINMNSNGDKEFRGAEKEDADNETPELDFEDVVDSKVDMSSLGFLKRGLDTDYTDNIQANLDKKKFSVNDYVPTDHSNKIAPLPETHELENSVYNYFHPNKNMEQMQSTRV